MSVPTHLGDHGQAQEKENDAGGECNFLTMRQEDARPVVHDAGDEGLYAAELSVDTQNLLMHVVHVKCIFALDMIMLKRDTRQKHREEDDCPEEGERQTEDQLWVGEKHQPRPSADDIVDRGVLRVHVQTMLLCSYRVLYRADLQMGHVAENGEHQHAGAYTSARVHHARDQGIPGEIEHY